MKNQHNQNNDLEGKIALVTGGTKGIGKAIANRLAQAGASVIITARNHPGENDCNHHFIPADLSLASEVIKVADEINELFGGVDILINNMGANTYPGGGYRSLADEHWDEALQVNLLSSVRLVLYYLKCWKRKVVLSFIFLPPAASLSFGNLPWLTVLLKLH